MARFRAEDLTVESNPTSRLVSDADRSAEELVRAQLKRTRPRDAVEGEEFETTGHGPRRWVIDPIDGTHNFVRRPAWATLISLVDEGSRSWDSSRPRPWGDDGGPQRLGRLVGPSRSPPPSASGSRGSPRIEDASLSYSSLSGWRASTGTRSSSTSPTGVAHPGLRRLLVVHARRRGRGGHRGGAGPRLHDMAALVPIVTEAGGRFTSLDGTDGPWGATRSRPTACCTTRCSRAWAPTPAPDARACRPCEPWPSGGDDPTSPMPSPRTPSAYGWRRRP